MRVAAALAIGAAVVGQPIEEVGGVAGIAVVGGDAGRDPDRGAAVCAVSAEQLIGQDGRAGAVTAARERVGQSQSDVRPVGPGADRGPQ